MELPSTISPQEPNPYFWLRWTTSAVKRWCHFSGPLAIPEYMVATPLRNPHSEFYKDFCERPPPPPFYSRNILKYIINHILAFNLLRNMILVANHTFSESRRRLNLLLIAKFFYVKSKMVAKNNEKSHILSL